MIDEAIGVEFWEVEGIEVDSTLTVDRRLRIGSEMPNATPIARKIPARALKPVLRRSVADDALDHLRKAIIAGAYAPGDHLAEASLADQLDVSRAPVREAMFQLEREGLLIFDRRGAARVREFSEADLEEIFTLRLTLEPTGARMACRHFDASLAAALGANILRTLAATDLLEVTLIDVAFHDIVMQAARHSRLYGCWITLRHQLEYWLSRMQRTAASSGQHTREVTGDCHRKLLRALRSRNEQRAEQAMRTHIEGWRRQLPQHKG